MLYQIVGTSSVLQLNYYALYYSFNWIFPEYNSLDESKKSELVARVNSMCMAIYFSASYFFVTTPAHIIDIYTIYAGYILYDFRYSGTLSMILHHIASLMACYYIKFYADYSELYKYHTILISMEISLVLLSVCWILRIFKYPMNTIHKTVIILAYIFWTGARMVVFPYIVYHTPTPNIRIKMIPFILLNTYWFVLLTRIVFFKKMKA
jgi:hypothetical protein